MTQQAKRVKTSIRVLQSVIVLIVLILLGQMINLQVLQYETYSPLSRDNIVRQEYLQPARGLVYDRNGELVVDNEPIYTINVLPSAFDTTKIPLLSRLLSVNETDVRERIQKARRYSWYRPSRFYTELDLATFSLIQENIWQLPGISHQIESKRQYPSKAMASHAFGYLSELTEQEYKSLSGYMLGDKAGRSGLENIYESQLRGQLGAQYVRINALGQSVGNFDDGTLDQTPTKGNDLVTTLQLDLQMMAESLMVNKTGAIVAMNPNTGGILAMASAPLYDLNRLSGKLDRAYWAEINADTLTPLYNRAVSSRQPPGSTVKPFMSLAALYLGVIDEKTQIYNPGAFYKGREYKDLAPIGNYTVETAIQKSSNTFFFTVMDRMMAKHGLNRWHDLFAEAGLGHINNIDIPNENPGILPDSAYFDRVFGKRKWGIGDLLNLGIGQGTFAVTPLQMALVASELANGGYWVRPHLVKSIRRPNGSLIEIPVRKNKISWITEDNLRLVHRGMRKVVTEGSGRFYANLDFVEVAGKTGTSQNPHGKDHGWFICFAPLENPQIAVAVLVENGGFASISAAPIAALMLEQYFLGKIKRKWVLDRMLAFNPILENKNYSPQEDE